MVVGVVVVGAIEVVIKLDDPVTDVVVAAVVVVVSVIVVGDVVATAKIWISE